MMNSSDTNAQHHWMWTQIIISWLLLTDVGNIAIEIWNAVLITIVVTTGEINALCLHSFHQLQHAAYVNIIINGKVMTIVKQHLYSREKKNWVVYNATLLLMVLTDRLVRHVQAILQQAPEELVMYWIVNATLVILGQMVVHAHCVKRVNIKKIEDLCLV